jgi:hypothetical protein
MVNSVKKQVLVAALFALFFSVLLFPRAGATTSATQEAPSTVKVGVWINDIEKVDVPAQTFTIDFYIWFKYHEIKPNIEFLKGAPTMNLVREEERSTENYLEYRVRGAYVGSLDFRNFPLDEHLLTVELEDKEHGTSQLVFEPDIEESGLDPELEVAGWDVKDFRLYEEKHAYPDENYSRFVFGVTIYRSKVSAMFKNFLPILIITLISLLTFSISVKNFGQRVSICVTTLMSAVAYHLAALSGLPSLGYLTLFDRIMLVVYTLFLYNLMVSVQAMRLVEAGKVKQAEKFETRMQNLIPIFVAGLFLLWVGVLGLL